MKIAGCTIQNKNIEVDSPQDFTARYKGRLITVTTGHGHGHGHGAAKYSHLDRFHISVLHEKTGMLDVETYEDHHCIRDAIRCALVGAGLDRL